MGPTGLIGDTGLIAILVKELEELKQRLSLLEKN
jgi:hypothetical protein